MKKDKPNQKPIKIIRKRKGQIKYHILTVLVVLSILFAVYKNFTVVDTHTITQETIIKHEIIDTTGIQSFVKNFAKEFYSWSNDELAQKKRNDRLSLYMSDELYRINSGSIVSELHESSQVTDVQIWEIESDNEETFNIWYTVDQRLIVNQEENQKNNNIVSSYKLTIHKDAKGAYVVTGNPSPYKMPEASSYMEEIKINDQDVPLQEVETFLQTFFGLYPNASKQELDFFVLDEAVPLIESGRYSFENILSLVIQETEVDNVYMVFTTIRFSDNLTDMEHISQYELFITKNDNWQITSPEAGRVNPT